MKNSQTILIEHIIGDSLFEQPDSEQTNKEYDTIARLVGTTDQQLDSADNTQLDGYIRALGLTPSNVKDSIQKWKYVTINDSLRGEGDDGRVSAILDGLSTIKRNQDQMWNDMVWIISPPRKRAAVKTKDGEEKGTNPKVKKNRWYYNLVGIPKNLIGKDLDGWVSEKNFKPYYGNTTAREKPKGRSLVIRYDQISQLKDAITYEPSVSDDITATRLVTINTQFGKVTLKATENQSIWDAAVQQKVLPINGITSNSYPELIQELQKELRGAITINGLGAWQGLENTLSKTDEGKAYIELNCNKVRSDWSTLNDSIKQLVRDNVIKQLLRYRDDFGKDNPDGKWRNGTKFAIWFVLNTKYGATWPTDASNIFDEDNTYKILSLDILNKIYKEAYGKK